MFSILFLISNCNYFDRHGTLTSAELLSEHENAKESELCLAQSKTSSGKLVAASVAHRSSTRKLDADPISVSSSAVHLYKKRTIPTTERKWTSIPANSSYGGGSLSIAISKMVTRLVRHCDQEERQSDVAVHWDTIRPKLLKTCAKQGARDFSEEDWLRLFHEGSCKTRFEYCEDSKNSLAYLRAIQGHCGVATIAPELMEHNLIPYDWKEFVFHRVLPSAFIPSLRTDSWQDEEGRQTIFFTPLNLFG